MNKLNKHLDRVAIPLIIIFVFSNFFYIDGFNWDNLVMVPIVFAIIYFLRTFILEIIHNKVNNKPYIVEQKYKLYTLLKKNDYRLDEIEAYIIKYEDINDAKRIQSILRKNNIKIYSVNQIQALIETGEIENIISKITDKHSVKELKEIMSKYGTEIGFMKLRIRYETKFLLDTEKSFSSTSGALSILSIFLGYYLVQDIWNFFCANWINLLLAAVLLIADVIVFYSEKNKGIYAYYFERYKEVKYYIDMMDNEERC